MDGQWPCQPGESGGHGHVPLWKQRYLAARSEDDPAKLSQRIDDARDAMLDRIAEGFSEQSSDTEQVELRVALDALNFLLERATCSTRNSLPTDLDCSDKDKK
jgi:hypothetical protein